MQKNKKHKEFIKKLRNQSKCKIEPMDIYTKTDFFDNSSKKLNHTYKFAFIASLILIAISITVISILGVKNYKLLNQEPEVVYIEKFKYMIDDSDGMTNDEKVILSNELNYFSHNPICTYSHDRKIIMYIYNGYKLNENNTKTYYYYYSFNLTNYSTALDLCINNEHFKISSENRSGLLNVIDESKTDNLVFSFTVESEICAKNYIFDASNY